MMRGKEDPYLMIGQENDRTQKGSSEYVWSLTDINSDSAGLCPVFRKT
jgi:lipopolysaccharide transport system ATP-binding protein